MTAKEARKLLPGTVVMWDKNPDDLGTVRDIGRYSFYVDWANGQQGWIAFDDAIQVSIR